MADEFEGIRRMLRMLISGQTEEREAANKEFESLSVNRFDVFLTLIGRALFDSGHPDVGRIAVTVLANQVRTNPNILSDGAIDVFWSVIVGRLVEFLSFTEIPDNLKRLVTDGVARVIVVAHGRGRETFQRNLMEAYSAHREFAKFLVPTIARVINEAHGFAGFPTEIVLQMIKAETETPGPGCVFALSLYLASIRCFPETGKPIEWFMLLLGRIAEEQKHEAIGLLLDFCDLDQDALFVFPREVLGQFIVYLCTQMIRGCAYDAVKTAALQLLVSVAKQTRLMLQNERDPGSVTLQRGILSCLLQTMAEVPADAPLLRSDDDDMEQLYPYTVAAECFGQITNDVGGVSLGRVFVALKNEIFAMTPPSPGMCYAVFAGIAHCSHRLELESLSGQCKCDRAGKIQLIHSVFRLVQPIVDVSLRKEEPARMRVIAVQALKVLADKTMLIVNPWCSEFVNQDPEAEAQVGGMVRYLEAVFARIVEAIPKETEGIMVRLILEVVERHLDRGRVEQIAPYVNSLWMMMMAAITNSRSDDDLRIVSIRNLGSIARASRKERGQTGRVIEFILCMGNLVHEASIPVRIVALDEFITIGQYIDDVPLPHQDDHVKRINIMRSFMVETQRIMMSAHAFRDEDEKILQKAVNCILQYLRKKGAGKDFAAEVLPKLLERATRDLRPKYSRGDANSDSIAESVVVCGTHVSSGEKVYFAKRKVDSIMDDLEMIGSCLSGETASTEVVARVEEICLKWLRFEFSVVGIDAAPWQLMKSLGCAEGESGTAVKLHIIEWALELTRPSESLEVPAKVVVAVIDALISLKEMGIVPPRDKMVQLLNMWKRFVEQALRKMRYMFDLQQRVANEVDESDIELSNVVERGVEIGKFLGCALSVSPELTAEFFISQLDGPLMGMLGEQATRSFATAMFSTYLLETGDWAKFTVLVPAFHELLTHSVSLDNAKDAEANRDMIERVLDVLVEMFNRYTPSLPLARSMYEMLMSLVNVHRDRLDNLEDWDIVSDYILLAVSALMRGHFAAFNTEEAAHQWSDLFPLWVKTDEGAENICFLFISYFETDNPYFALEDNRIEVVQRIFFSRLICYTTDETRARIIAYLKYMSTKPEYPGFVKQVLKVTPIAERKAPVQNVLEAIRSGTHEDVAVAIDAIMSNGI